MGRGDGKKGREERMGRRERKRGWEEGKGRGDGKRRREEGKGTRRGKQKPSLMTQIYACNHLVRNINLVTAFMKNRPPLART